ncbi:hypothetical protein, partial [Methanoculleus chikugoensis]|uniref:hypothetical protein n=1 Tax=Methanoculleus chikugoensis TaxID=118126 RepID=UPI001FB3E92D
LRLRRILQRRFVRRARPPLPGVGRHLRLRTGTVKRVLAWVAGWGGFVVGKLASCSAVALTFGYYLIPGYARHLAAGGR